MDSPELAVDPVLEHDWLLTMQLPLAVHSPVPSPSPSPHRHRRLFSIPSSSSAVYF